MLQVITTYGWYQIKKEEETSLLPLPPTNTHLYNTQPSILVSVAALLSDYNALPLCLTYEHSD